VAKHHDGFHMQTRCGWAARLLSSLLVSLLVFWVGSTVAAAAAAGDTTQGTFTVNGKTRLFKYVYVTRAANPEQPHAHYLIILVSDAEVPASSRVPPALADLARRGQIHAVRVIWKEGTDSLVATPFHSEVEGSGQPTVGGTMIDLRAYNERRLSAQINSKPLGQAWHFNATLEAAVVPATLTKEDLAEPVPIVPETTDVERDTRHEKLESDDRDPLSIKRTLGRLNFAATEEGFLQAVNEGNLQAVTLFLRLGLNASAVVDDMPLLMSAVMHCTSAPAEGRIDIIRALLAGHAKVDVADENGSTPLLWSVNVSCPADVARLLIAAGANVNVKAKGGATPMMLAKVHNRADIIKLLQAAGARP
jgi:hypothetical protein